jgi:hypothetical protein
VRARGIKFVVGRSGTPEAFGASRGDFQIEVKETIEMNTIVVTYLTYICISIALTVWVAQTLHRNGRVFLVDVFHGNESLADSVNHLLVVGFYLINFGYVSLALKLGYQIQSAQEGIEALSWKVGMVLIVLGGMHFFNLYIFSRIRRRAHAQNGAFPPPPAPKRQGFVTFREDEPQKA